MSTITGIEALDRRLDSFKAQQVRAAGRMLEEQATLTQRDLVNMVPHRTGRAVNALAAPDAVKLIRDKAGNVVQAQVGLLTSENRKRAFHLFFLEKGREAGQVGGKRRSGRYKSGERRYKKLTRRVGAMAPRHYFRIAFTLMRARLKTARGIANFKAFIADNVANL